ncbi:cytochrome P450 [Dendrothele bispora CBS 962.96]|uniref:Cytochrome P450 n=1 Tax=Dendrothele bispora (strain CBS 962.96) TaxID=1314807 RepID=A0A4S8KSY2_DENBC|nr:cytochrome P450 [Dendrothele bispora CBS 962.96]
MSLNSSTILELAAVAIASVVWIYLRKQTRYHSYSPANLPGPRAKSWWTGSLKEAFSPRAWDFNERLLKEYGPVVRLDGVMGDKQLLVYDPKALYHILVKDAALYERSNATGSALIFGKGLTGITGEPHRKQRKALNPVFSIAHLRDMLPIFYDVVHKLEVGLESKFKNGNKPQEIEMLSWMSRTALELIGQSGLGYSFDTLTDDAIAHPYTGIVKQLVPALGRLGIWRSYLLPLVMKIGTPSFRRRVLDVVPWDNLHRVRDMSDYMWEISKEIYEGKKKALEEGDEILQSQVGRGKDLMSILMKLNMNEDGENKLDEDEVLGQMSVLIFAAMDTTSSALSRVLHLLSTRPEVQDKLRQEVLEARLKHGDIPYDELVSLPYLDAICRETLRLFPPVTQILRHAKQDTLLPLSNPIIGVDGTPISEVHVPRNTKIIMSPLNSNRNPAIWGPDSLEWKPERWLEGLPDEVVDAHIPGVYSHLMTFNAGGRSCIGFKFSQLEMKVVLTMLIAKFKFGSTDKKIYWQMNGISSPSVIEGDDLKGPQMPLVVSRVEDA